MPQSDRDAALAEIRDLQAAHWPQQVPRDVAHPVEVPTQPPSRSASDLFDFDRAATLAASRDDSVGTYP